jgi:hypothetical protein
MLRRLRRRSREPGIHIGDPRFDGWDVVRDFDDLDSALAWRQHLEVAGVECALTSDWPLDRFGRGDVALRVPPGRWSEAEQVLGEFDD